MQEHIETVGSSPQVARRAEVALAELPFGLRLALLLLAVVDIAVGLANMAVPKTMADLAGFPGVELATYQNLGAAILGYGVAALLAFRARTWEEVRIPLVFILTFALFSGLGGLYYFLFQGVRAPLPILDAVLSVYLVVVCGYSLWTHRKSMGGVER